MLFSGVLVATVSQARMYLNRPAHEKGASFALMRQTQEATAESVCILITPESLNILVLNVHSWTVLGGRDGGGTTGVAGAKAGA